MGVYLYPSGTEKSLKNAYIGEYVQNFATQGPCPDGFHVPTNNEWSNIIDLGVTLGAWTTSGGSDFKARLKIPFAGLRASDNASISLQGTTGYYFSSTNSSNPRGYGISLGSASIAKNQSLIKRLGASIRPFKNTAVMPNSSWTAIYQGTGNAGIYWSSTLGLISISSDGTNWITIADKNLGATTVYSDGATLSEANCGKYYQWGNNYGFAWTGSVTTSSTQVNAGSYGPGNYYSSSTFICFSGFTDGWDSSNNANLRGGVDGNVPVD